MNISNITSGRLFKAIVISIVILFMLVIRAYAQTETPISVSLRNNLEKFEEYRTTDHEKALYYALLIDQDSDTTSISRYNATVYDFIAHNSEETKFNYHEALRYKLRSKQIYNSLKEDSLEVTTLADIGRLYLRTGDYHSAFTFSQQALSKSDTIRDRLAVRETYLTLELINYFYQKDTVIAMKYNRHIAGNYNNREEARQSMRALNNRFHYPITPKQVEDILEKSIALSRQYDFEDLLVSIYLNVALKQILFNDMEACARYLALAEPMIRTIKDEGYYYSALGFYHVNCGNNRQAIKAALRSIEILSQGDFGETNVHTYFLLQELYRMEGRYREAYDALMQFAQTYTRQNSPESVIALSKLINELELKHAKEGYRQQQLAMEQQREYNSLLNKIYICSLIVVIIVGILIISRYRLQHKHNVLTKAKAEQEIAHKNEIIKVQRLQQYQEQSHISKLTEELIMAMNIQDNKELRSELRLIIQRLQKDSNKSNDWVEVEKMMEDNNDIFFANLLRAYPNLTKNERKLCTFIHMNLSTKDISKITHQSVGSINIARSRLRRKFGITGDDKSLLTFLDRFNAPE